MSSNQPVSQYQRKAIHVFCSYAPQDKFLRDRLETQLSTFKRSGLMTVWHNQEIAAGMDWKQQIDTQINLADIILLLLSADFMASDYCYGQEMRLAIERHKRGDAHVLPILLRPVHLEGAPLTELATLPRDETGLGDGLPITQWNDLDKALYHVANEIQVTATKLRQQMERKYWIEEGKRLTEKGQYDQAQKAYNTVLRTFPNDPDNKKIYLYRAGILRRLGPEHYKEAKEMYEAAIKLDPQGFPPSPHFGDILVELFLYPDALNVYDHAIRADPQNSQLLQKKGDVLCKLDRYEEALVSYDMALKLVSTPQIILYLHKGYALRCLRRYKEALETYNQALQHDPVNTVLWVLKGTTLCEMEQYDPAVEAYEQALTIDPTLTLASYGKVFALTTNPLDVLLPPRQATQAYEEAKLFGYSDLFQSRKLFSPSTDHVYCSRKHKNWYGASFCRTCGEKLRSKTTSHSCLNCQFLCRTEDNFCSNCGHPFTGGLMWTEEL